MGGIELTYSHSEEGRGERREGQRRVYKHSSSLSWSLGHQSITTSSALQLETTIDSKQLTVNITTTNYIPTTTQSTTTMSYNTSRLPAYSNGPLPAYSEATRGQAPITIMDEKKAQQEPKKSKFAQIKTALKSIPLDPVETEAGLGEWPVMQSIELKTAYLTKGRF